MSISSTIQVRQASVTDLDAVAPLFDGYRQFYGKPGDIGLARSFLEERLRNNQSVIFVATQSDGTSVGFTQLYPSFSSVAAARVFILNDLYVATEARRRGVGARLLQAAALFGRSTGRFVWFCPRLSIMNLLRLYICLKVGFVTPNFMFTVCRCNRS